MLPRNFAVIIVVAFVSILCYSKHRQTKPALFVADALNLIDAYYVDPVESDKLLGAALTGMTDTLDEHSSYIPGDALATFQDSINQEFAGIGILVEQPEIGKPVRVITPLVGSPALAAGLMPGDEIIRVDGAEVSTQDIGQVSSQLRGPVGTRVSLVVLRKDVEVELSIARATIAMESVIGDHRGEDNTWVYRLADDPEIAYVRLTSFGDKTVEELTTVLNKLDNQFRGLVLDLRGNGGGLLYSAVDICDMFLDEGKIVSTRMRGGDVNESFSAEVGTLVDLEKPIAVLVDGDSASASEIVAACLQDNERAVVVGMRSYGKGTVQEIMPLQYGRAALRLTIARYYRPNDHNIHRLKDASEEDEWGVRPDSGYEVAIDDATLEKLVRRWREASYPLLVGIEPKVLDSAADETDSADEAAAVDEEDSEPKAAAASATTSSGLLLDPQLRRAVEYVDEQSGAAKKPAEIAA